MDWWKQAVVYQVYPRSFADASGDGVGDLRGVIDRLDYLAWLGVDAIWLSPIFASPMADFGYDISDHCRIDPLFGTDHDAQNLIAAAHAHGIKVMFDIVLGHTSDQHDWFQQSRASRNSALRDFYVWRDGPTPGSAEGGPPNNWEAGFPAGARAWTFDEQTDQWYLHSHLPEQPDLNWENPAVAAAQEQVLRFWLDRGIDGIRLDSINRLGKDPALRNNIPGAPLRQQDWPNLHPRLAHVRRISNEYPGTVAVGETWLFDQAQIVPYLSDEELHLAHNFVFARADAHASTLADIISEFGNLVPDPDKAAWFFSNHDEPRLRSRLDQDGHGLERAELLAVLLMSLRGTAFIYQGEELGLPDAEIPADRVVDRNGRDPQRAPIPWQDPRCVGPGAGFSSVDPWLPVTSSAPTLNVEAQRHSATSTLALYRELIGLRHCLLASPTSPHTASIAAPDVLRITNHSQGKKITSLLNFSLQHVAVPHTVDGEVLISTDRTRPRSALRGAVDLGPLEAVIVAEDKLG